MHAGAPSALISRGGAFFIGSLPFLEEERYFELEALFVELIGRQ